MFLLLSLMSSCVLCRKTLLTATLWPLFSLLLLPMPVLYKASSLSLSKLIRPILPTPIRSLRPERRLLSLASPNLLLGHPHPLAAYSQSLPFHNCPQSLLENMLASLLPSPDQPSFQNKLSRR